MVQEFVQRRLRQPRDDSGFTLIELLVAMMVIGTVLFSLMAVQTAALVTTAQSRQRTQATAIANQVMEELRALPWLVLSKGLHSSFASAGGGDPNVAAGRLRPPSNLSIDEPLVTSTAQATDKAPLSGAGGTNKVIDSDPSSPGMAFTSRTYVTSSAATASGVITLTVITSWTANQTGSSKSVVLRSVAYAPAGGCGDASNQPFLGACQALLSGGAGVTAPSTTITAASADPMAGGAASGTPILPGSTTTVASLVGGQSGIGVTSQQSTSVDSSVLHAGVTLGTADAAVPPTTYGLTKLTNAASNDVGASGAAPPNPGDVSGVGAGASATLSTPTVALTLTAPAVVSGVAKASMAASCASGVPAGQGCGATTVTGGSAGSVGLTVDGAAFGVATVAGGGTASSFAGRFSTAAGSSAVGCAVLSGPGCIAAGVQRTVPTASFGSGAWSGGAAPSGLVTVSGYSDAVRVERGLSQRTSAASTSRAAAVSYWNGSGYSSLTIDRLTSQTVVTPAVSWVQGASNVQVSATVTVTPAMSIASNPDPVGCGGEGCTVDADTGTVTVALTWTITSGGGVQAFTAASTMGGSRVNAAFKAAPSA